MVCIGGVNNATRVGVIGLGGLGRFGASIGASRGAQVLCADHRAISNDWGTASGVDRVVASTEEFAGANLDVVVDFVGGGSTLAQAMRRTGPMARWCRSGCTAISASNRRFIHKRALLAGFHGGELDDVRRVLEMMAGGRLAPTLEPVEFDSVDETIIRLRSGEIDGRAVAVVAP